VPYPKSKFLKIAEAGLLTPLVATAGRSFRYK